MEDGKYRHLHQLEEKKEEILRNIPGQSLRDHMEFMKLNIKGRKFPLSVFSCCLSNKYKQLSSQFTQSFESLQTQNKLSYYRKYIDTSYSVSKRVMKMSTLSKVLENNPTGRQSSSVLYRMSRFDHWRTTMATLDHNNKTLETVTMKIDLHRAFVTHFQEKVSKSGILCITPWKDHQNYLQFKKNQLTPTDFFQRISYLAELALEDNIVKTIEGQESPPSSENQDSPSSDRSMKNRILTQTHLLAKQTIREVNQLNYLKYQHQLNPLKTDLQPKRLIPQKNIHYFLQDDWQLNSDGQLLVTNSSKIEAQGSVIKYVIKRIFTGDKIFSISLPVSVFGEESNLSLLINSYRSAPLELGPAALEQHPLRRFLKVIRFAFTCPPSYIRCDKPFNPILGETYQSTVNGTLFYGQQISHHPPISSVLIKGNGFTAYGSFEAEVNFGLNSASGNNSGWLYISFDKDDIRKKVVRFSNAPGEMSGLLFGSRKFILKEKIFFIDEQHLLYCELTFGSVKYQKGKEYSDSIEGKVVKLKKGTPLNNLQTLRNYGVEEDYGLISGRWLSEIYFNNELLINTLREYPPEMERYPAVLPSDCSLRQDVILKKKGDQEHCQTAKQNLQEIQRNDRKLREQFKR